MTRWGSSTCSPRPGWAACSPGGPGLSMAGPGPEAPVHTRPGWDSAQGTLEAGEAGSLFSLGPRDPSQPFLALGVPVHTRPGWGSARGTSEQGRLALCFLLAPGTPLNLSCVRCCAAGQQKDRSHPGPGMPGAAPFSSPSPALEE